jgi:hypothetical protein
LPAIEGVSPLAIAGAVAVTRRNVIPAWLTSGTGSRVGIIA